MPYPPDVRVAVLIAGIPLVLGLLNSAFVAVLQSDLRAGRIAIADVAGRAAALAAVALVAALDLGFYAVVSTAGIGAAVTLALTSLLARALAAGAAAAPTARRCGGCCSRRCRSASRSRSTRRTSAPTR